MQAILKAADAEMYLYKQEQKMSPAKNREHQG